MHSNLPPGSSSLHQTWPEVTKGIWPDPLKVGVYVDSPKVSAWVYDLLIALDEDHQFRLSAVVMPFKKVVRKSQTGLIFSLAEHLDAHLTHLETDAFHRCDASALFASLEQHQYHAAQNWSAIDVDLMIYLAPGEPKQVLAKGLPFGLWSLHLLNAKLERIAYWQLAGEHTTDLNHQICVYREGQPSRQHVIHSPSTSTSLIENRNRFAWKTAAYLPRFLKELHEHGENLFETMDIVNQASRDIYAKAGSLQGLSLLARMTLKRASNKLARLTHRQQWGLYFAETGSFNEPLHNLRPCFPKRDRFWADPFLISNEGRRWCFLEELVWREKKGKISVIDVDKPELGARVVLEKPYHLSYPFVFSYEGRHFMIPETRSNRSIELYEATNFPYQWRFAATLMSGVEAVDTTLLEHEGRWWMFVNMASHPGASTWDELYLFHAPHPFSQNWVPHEKNPVVTNVRCARPAGRIMHTAEGLIRPAQDCRRPEGKHRPGVQFMKIEALNLKNYSESLVHQLSPDWNRRIKRIHTYNEDGDTIVFDGLLERFL